MRAMLVGYSYDPIYARHDMGAGHPECPERVQVIDAHLRSVGLFERLVSFKAEPASRDDVLRAHEANYVERVFALAPGPGETVQLDGDTAMNEASLSAALSAAGAAISAVDHVLDGSFSRAFCNVRPPGHHAESDRAMGFCIFNSIAIAARYACLVRGLQRVAIVDWDVHHGNGTEEILAGDARVFMVHSFQSPLYPYSGVEPLGENTCNMPLPAFSDGTKLRERWTKEAIPELEAFNPELILISAGFDAHRDDPLAQLKWTEQDFAWLTRQLHELSLRTACQGKIVSLLEGGYNLKALALSVEAHVRGLMADHH
jgi:acetoin utilization deacetylase AcuC-like enzyme